MDMLEIIKGCRSVRKYTSEQIAREDLERIVEAGIYSPNAGGAQRSMVVALHDADLAEKVGKLNMARFDRGNLFGSQVSSTTPPSRTASMAPRLPSACSAKRISPSASLTPL